MSCLYSALLLVVAGSATDSLWTETGEGYSISVSFPGAALEIPVLADALSEYASGQVRAFRNNYKSVTRDYPEPMDWSLDITFTLEPSPDGLVCLLAWSWEYSGGAHGNSWSVSFIYDIENEVFVEPTDLFRDPSEFAALAESAARILREQLGEDHWIEAGTAPSPENYRCLLPVPDSTGAVAGYSVIFAPYQVAPYVYGPQEVFIPLER